MREELKTAILSEAASAGSSPQHGYESDAGMINVSEKVIALFQKSDSNQDGVLSPIELHKALVDLGVGVSDSECRPENRRARASTCYSNTFVLINAKLELSTLDMWRILEVLL